MNKMSYFHRSIQDILLRDMRINRVKAPDQDVGLELEVEGRNLPAIATNTWICHADHSLRGEAVEYIFNGIKSFDAVPAALAELRKFLTAPNVRVNQGRRTSVHVHINAIDMFAQQIYTFVCLYLLVEDFLVNFSGPDRVGNMYCLRFSDAEYLPLKLIQGIQDGSYLHAIAGDDVRYSSLNLKALMSLGSLEFRSFRGTIDQNEICTWIEILRDLKTYASRFNSPLDVLLHCDTVGPKGIVESFKVKAFRDFIYSMPNWQTHIEQGYAYAFEIAHAPLRNDPWVDLSKAPKVDTKAKKSVAEQPRIIQDEFFREHIAAPVAQAPRRVPQFDPAGNLRFVNEAPLGQAERDVLFGGNPIHPQGNWEQVDPPLAMPDDFEMP